MLSPFMRTLVSFSYLVVRIPIVTTVQMQVVRPSIWSSIGSHFACQIPQAASILQQSFANETLMLSDILSGLTTTLNFINVEHYFLAVNRRFFSKLP